MANNSRSFAMRGVLRSESDFCIEVFLVEIDRVRPTEAVDPDFVETLVAGINAVGVWSHPVLLEKESGAIMDGHHRFEAAKRLGLRAIPAVFASYDNPQIHLKTWRPGIRFSAQEILQRARSGDLLPYKSTRHVTDFVLPQVRVPISTLKSGDVTRQPIANAKQHPSRGMMLVSDYTRFCSRLLIKPNAVANVEIENPETQAPHAQLRRTLQSDPAMSALLPVAPGRIVLGFSDDSPFFLTRSGYLRLPPTLLNDALALSVATRWGFEASHLQSSGLLTPETVQGVLLHGRSLMRAAASIESRDLLLNGVPLRIARELLSDGSEPPSETLLAWQQSRIESLSGAPPAPGKTTEPIELWNSVETLLVSGGDTRLVVNGRTGFNRYGTTPRPRPEAVHFSSSTASSISDYGFMYCDMLRRDLMTAMFREKLTPQQLRARAVDAIAASLLELLGLEPSEADAALAPSGTDTEMVAVLVSVAGGRPVTNILIAPEETGRGVSLAGAGRFYDSMAASGALIVKGQSAWPGADINVVEIPIRNDDGSPRDNGVIEDDVQREVRDACAKGRRVLLHVLASSKTGLAAPTEEAIARVLQIDPTSIDVVVDACQMRTPFLNIGEWARKGWLVQISGSKFLTGPPFSGALILPRSFRARAKRIGELLYQAPAVGFGGDWTSWWRDVFPSQTCEENTSFGLIFRWLPALLEAELFNAIPNELRQASFERFRKALTARLDKSQWLVRMDDSRGDERGVATGDDLASQSIICFSVVVSHWDGEVRALGEEECRSIFNLLNLDLSRALGQLGPAEAALARLQAHIGQPVSLQSKSSVSDPAVLRMVLGARFFSIVAHAGPGSVDAALESEIADAVRALEKLEFLARIWHKAKNVVL